MTTRQRMAPLRYDPREIDAKWQRRWADDALYQVRDDDPRPRWYALTMYPYPSGDLHIGHWYAMAPSDAHARFMRMRGYNVLHPMGFDAFGLPRGECGDQSRHPSGALDDGQHPAHARAVAVDGPGVRLEPRGGYVPAGVLRVEPVVLPADVREGAGLPGVRAGELVSHLPDGARERAGRGRQVRAHGRHRHQARDGPVVLQDHGLRRRIARLLRRRGLAGAHQDDADELDRAQRGRRYLVRHLGVRPGHP